MKVCFTGPGWNWESLRYNWKISRVTDLILKIQNSWNGVWKIWSGPQKEQFELKLIHILYRVKHYVETNMAIIYLKKFGNKSKFKFSATCCKIKRALSYKDIRVPQVTRHLKKINRFTALSAICTVSDIKLSIFPRSLCS